MIRERESSNIQILLSLYNYDLINELKKYNEEKRKENKYLYIHTHTHTPHIYILYCQFF